MTYWWLGEAVNYCHVVFVICTIWCGWLWIRPVWAWLAIVASMVLSWQIVDGCVLTMLANWLQGRHGNSYYPAFMETYGQAYCDNVVGALVLVGLLLALCLCYIVHRNVDDAWRSEPTVRRRIACFVKRNVQPAS